MAKAKYKLLSSKLKSRKVRKSSFGSSGKRKFKGNSLKAKDKKGNTFTQFFDSTGQFLKSLISDGIKAITSFLSFSLSAIWNGIVTAFTWAWNFDWNISDLTLEQQALGSFATLGSSFGSLAGTSVGWLVCGVLPGTIVAYFSPSLGLLIKQQVGPAALEAIVGEFGSLLQQSANVLSQYAFAYLYKNLRNFVRGTDQEFFDKQLQNGVPIKDIKKSMEERKKPFIISEIVENKISKIKNPFVQNFASSFLDSLGESCVEAGYAVAGAADDYFAKQKLSRNPLLGAETTIEVTFDENDEPQFKRDKKVDKFKFTNDSKNVT